MTYSPHISRQKGTALQRVLGLPVLQLLLVGLYCLLGRFPNQTGRQVYTVPHHRPVSRAVKRQRLRIARGGTPRNNRALRHFMRKGLSGTQFLERCTKLSAMGRFQIYNWLYYRWEFWRLGAMKQRFRSPQGALGIVVGSCSCGLSAVHLGPD